MKFTNSIAALICTLGLAAHATAGEKLLCVPKETQNQTFKCLISNYELKLKVDRSSGRIEVVTNTNRHIMMTAVVDQDAAGLTEVAFKSRGMKGYLDLLHSKRSPDGREVPSKLFVFDERIDFSGSLICQGVHGATMALKEACGI